MVVVFTLNSNFIEPFSVALKSLLNTNSYYRVKCYCLCYNVSYEDIIKLEEIVSGSNLYLKFIHIRIDKVIQLPSMLHLNMANYFRLLIPDYIIENKVIYLDSDLIINGDLLDLWDLNIDQYYLAAAPEFSQNYNPNLPFDKEKGYFNSGVMVLNLEKWRKFDLGARVISFIANYGYLISFADQCGLNACVKGDFLLLDPKYNFQSLFFEKNFNIPENLKIFRLDPSNNGITIIHFTGSNKPWNWGNKHPYRFLYWKILRTTPFKKLVPNPFSFIGLLKEFLPKSYIDMLYSFKNRVKIFNKSFKIYRFN